MVLFPSLSFTIQSFCPFFSRFLKILFYNLKIHTTYLLPSPSVNDNIKKAVLFRFKLWNIHWVFAVSCLSY